MNFSIHNIQNNVEKEYSKPFLLNPGHEEPNHPSKDEGTRHLCSERLARVEHNAAGVTCCAPAAACWLSLQLSVLQRQ